MASKEKILVTPVNQQAIFAFALPMRKVKCAGANVGGLTILETGKKESSTFWVNEDSAGFSVPNTLIEQFGSVENLRAILITRIDKVLADYAQILIDREKLKK